jgi:Ca-activated chloride channel family protein
MNTGLINRDDPLSDIPLIETKIAGKVCGTLAQIDMEQVYRNNGAKSIETIYIFPVPDMVFITDFSAVTGNAAINCFVIEKEEANKMYRKKPGESDIPFSCAQRPANLLRVAAGTLPPGQTVHIHISYIQEFRFDGCNLRIVIPAPAGREYAPSLPPKGAAGKEKNYCKTSLQISLNLLRRVLHYRSPTHNIDVIRLAADKAVISLADEYTGTDRDFVLICTCRGEQSSRGAACLNENNRGTVCLVFVPNLPSIDEGGAKNYIFLLDISDSMAGEKLAQTKSALNIFLRNLSQTDTFSIAAVESKLRLFSGGRSLPFAQVSLDRAAEWIDGLKPGGRGEISRAIEYAIPAGNSNQSMILLFTDGEIVCPDTTIDYIGRNIGRNRISVLGTEEAANNSLLDKIAAAGRGIYLHACPGERIDDMAIRRHAAIISAVSGNIQLDWAGIKTEGVFPGNISNLSDLEPVTVVAGFSGPLEGEIVLRGSTDQGDFCMAVKASDIEYDSGLGFLEKVWANKRIQYLEKTLPGKGMDGYEPVKNEIIKLSKNLCIPSSMTTLAAVKTGQDSPAIYSVRPVSAFVSAAPGKDMPCSGGGSAACGDILRALAANQQANGAFSKKVQDGLLTKVDTTALALIAFTAGNENIAMYTRLLEKSIRYLIERTVSGKVTPGQDGNSQTLLRTVLALKFCLARNIFNKTTEEWICQWLDDIKAVSETSLSLFEYQNEIAELIEDNTKWRNPQVIRKIAAINDHPADLEERIILSGSEADALPALARLGILKAISE